MRVTVAAIGRLKAGPERALVERYVERANASGRKLGLAVAVREFPESRAGDTATRKAQEAEALLSTVSPKAVLVVLDEAGRSQTSRAFADHIARWRDAGNEDVIFAIGGADGHGDALRARAGQTLAFGAMTWPHQIVRCLLAEQLYRAVTILSGHPYHRD
jgi:23S rRNA (pseudouridine1915-N3)-methyltransferase